MRQYPQGRQAPEGQPSDLGCWGQPVEQHRCQRPRPNRNRRPILRLARSPRRCGRRRSMTLAPMRCELLRRGGRRPRSVKGRRARLHEASGSRRRWSRPRVPPGYASFLDVPRPEGRPPGPSLRRRATPALYPRRTTCVLDGGHELRNDGLALGNQLGQAFHPRVIIGLRFLRSTVTRLVASGMRAMSISRSTGSANRGRSHIFHPAAKRGAGVSECDGPPWD